MCVYILQLCMHKLVIRFHAKFIFDTNCEVPTQYSPVQCIEAREKEKQEFYDVIVLQVNTHEKTLLSFHIQNLTLMLSYP